MTDKNELIQAQQNMDRYRDKQTDPGTTEPEWWEYLDDDPEAIRKMEKALYEKSPEVEF